MKTKIAAMLMACLVWTPNMILADDMERGSQIADCVNSETGLRASQLTEDNFHNFAQKPNSGFKRGYSFINGSVGWHTTWFV